MKQVTTLALLGVLASSVSAQDAPFVPDAEFARHFAEEWIASWNSHDLERVLSHYTDDFRMSSPRISYLGFDPSGTLQGKEAMRAYWGPSLGENSTVNMELITTLLGAKSITLYYRAVASGRLAAEVFLFNDDRLVHEAFAHYIVAEP